MSNVTQCCLFGPVLVKFPSDMIFNNIKKGQRPFLSYYDKKGRWPFVSVIEEIGLYHLNDLVARYKSPIHFLGVLLMFHLTAHISFKCSGVFVCLSWLIKPIIYVDF